MKIKQLTPLALALFAVAITNAQDLTQHPTATPFVNGVDGRPIKWGSTYLVSGSPYYNEEYQQADITLTTGEVYKDVKVKFNVVDHELQYQSDDGTELASTMLIKKIMFTSPFGSDNIFSGICLESSVGQLNKKDGDIYAVLDSGRISLLEKIFVSWRDEKKYGEATITRVFDRKEIMYIRNQQAQLQKLEKSRSFITAYMTDKKNEIDQFVTEHNPSFKTIEGLLEVIRYYNSLF